LNETIDLAALQAWIGRTETARDEVTPRLAQALSATFDSAEMPQSGEVAPRAIHWCLSPPSVRASCLGEDGHPERGGFLPPVALPRRMWGGSAVRFHDRLWVGDRVERRSRIADVTVRQGRSGTLCLVAIDHEISSPRGVAIVERQDIVYLGAKTAPKISAPALLAPEWRRAMQAGPLLLFRYSALTFNGHRIHYDRAYATTIEHYPGLVVHGPLQAALLIDFAAAILGDPPKTFSFRGLQPLFDFEPFELCARRTETGLMLWIGTGEGKQTMRAEAGW
jgi:3-methylfumaryl-CoA hydratase